MKETKGITLIALVITIVILIILATVAIGNITGSGGLLNRAQEGTEAYKVNEIKEKMEIAKATEWMDSLGNITPDGYFEQLEQEGIIGDKDADVEAVNEEEGIYQVTTDEGYIFEVTIDEDGNVDIEYAGKGEAVGPRVTGINLVGKTANSVEIEVETIRAEGATYTYSYKKVSDSTYTTPTNQDNSSNRYNYTGLAANETYNFKVVVTDKAGRTAEGYFNETTATIPSGDEGIVVGEVEWSGGKASVTVSTNEEGYTLEYQKNDGGWQAVPEGGKIDNLENGDIVDIRLTNGTSYGEETTITIEDTEDPVITEFKETAITESSIAVSVTANDNSDGTLTYEYKIGDGEYTTGTNISTHTFEGLAAGQEYVMIVRVTDGAGRSVTQTLTKTTNAMPGKETINVGITSWNNGQATITVSTTETGYTLEYQKNNGNWEEVPENGTISGLVHGDVIDVRLNNGISTSEELTFNVQDTEDPVISSFTETEVTENSITVETTASDNSKGTLKYEYRKGSENFVEGGTTYTFSGLEASTQYTLQVRVTDGAGRSKESSINVSTSAKLIIGLEQINETPESYYGKIVTGYTCDSPGVTTWRVYYADETNIYLIADDYIAAENAPDGQGGNKLYTISSSYRPNFTNIYKDYSGANWISQNSKGAKWLSGFLGANSYNTSSSSNINIRAVAYLMDTNVWSIYAGEDAEYAIGGPTIELFCASYKDTHPDRYIECSVTNSNGYSVKWSDGSYGTYISGIPVDFNKIYIKSDRNKATATWITSPSSYNSSNLMVINPSGSIGEVGYDIGGPGLRPIVCLKSEVQLESIDENTYKIVE